MGVAAHDRRHDLVYGQLVVGVLLGNPDQTIDRKQPDFQLFIVYLANRELKQLPYKFVPTEFRLSRRCLGLLPLGFGLVIGSRHPPPSKKKGNRAATNSAQPAKDFR